MPAVATASTAVTSGNIAPERSADRTRPTAGQAAAQRRAKESPVGQFLRSAARRLFVDRTAEYWLGAINPMWSLRDVRARVIALTDETPDTLTITLQPSDRFAGFTPGQFVTISVDVDGVRHRRCYTISSPPRADRTIDVTVRRVEGGRVSSYLHETLAVGDVVEISQATGTFVLSDGAGAPALFIAGGSGITAAMALIADLERRAQLDDVVVLHYERAGRAPIFDRRLALLAARFPGLRVDYLYTRNGRPDDHLSVETLARLVPDFAQRQTYVCGPPALVEAAEAIWSRVCDPARLHVERYAAAPRPAPAGDGADAGRVRFEYAEVDGASAGETVLGVAEAAGLRPATGCRMGICHTCTCTKLAGTVRDTRTGQLSGPGEESIQICVSVAVGDVRVAL